MLKTILLPIVVRAKLGAVADAKLIACYCLLPVSLFVAGLGLGKGSVSSVIHG